MFWIPFPAIDINASDIKALYRRSQALEKLGKLDQAFKDAQKCATLEPRNKNFQETLRRLGANIQEKVNARGSVLDSQILALGYISGLLVMLGTRGNRGG